jgi:tripartite-type tricarboxylate transporter receptor subunit TctC
MCPTAQPVSRPACRPGAGLFRGDPAPLLAHIRTGKLRALAVTTTSRVAVLPEVPAMDEFLPGYEASGWLGIGAPKSTPPATIDRLAKELAAFQTELDMKTRLLSSGVEPLRMTPAAFSKFIADETAKWAKVVKFAGIKAD